VTSHYNAGVFPPGIPIGTVSEVGGDTRAAELLIQVTPAVDFSDLQVVEVLLETGDLLEKGKGE
jgi:cell shape-determining protein MreC